MILLLPVLFPLPRTFSTTSAFSPDELGHLKGSYIHDEIDVPKKGWVGKEWATMQAALRKAKAPKSLRNGILSAEKWGWARALKESRGIYISGVRHFVPLVDHLNCASHADVRLKAVEYDEALGAVLADDDEEEDEEKHDDDDDAAAAAAAALSSTFPFFSASPRQLKAGEQLLINYRSSNADHLTFRGFILQDNPVDCVYLKLDIRGGGSLGFGPGPSSLDGQKRELLKRHSVNADADHERVCVCLGEHCSHDEVCLLSTYC